MGLDMYMYEAIISDREKLKEITDEETEKVDDEQLYLAVNRRTLDTGVEEFDFHEFKYWRKANAIHAYFDNALPQRVENCQLYHLPHSVIQGLAEKIGLVLNNRKMAEEVLPTTSGFFFGDTDYGEYYYSILESTFEKLQKVDPEKEYFYEVSW